MSMMICTGRILKLYVETSRKLLICSAFAGHPTLSQQYTVHTFTRPFKEREQLKNAAFAKRLESIYRVTAKDTVHNESVDAKSTASIHKSWSIFPKYRQLHDLCGKGDLTGVRRCIAEGADVNDADDIGLTPLHCAAQIGHTEIARELIRAGATVDSEAIGFYYEGKTPLWYALWFNKDITTATLLRDYGANLNHQDKDENTLLHRAIFQKRADVVRKILDLGADVNTPNKDGFTPEKLLSSDAILLREQLLIRK